MKFAINKDVVLSRVPEGPLAAHLVAFAEYVSAQGYSAYSLKRHVRKASGFSRWLKQRGVRLRGICADHRVAYLRSHARNVRIRWGDAAALQHLLDFLRRDGVIPAEKMSVRRLRPVQRCIQTYEQYLGEVRGLAPATITNYVPFVEAFLSERFGDRRLALSRLCSSDVVRFVQRHAPRLHLKRAKLMTCALRSFLRYVRYRGDIAPDLAAAVPTVANWSMRAIPRAIAPDQVERLLASIERDTATGRRDYAIVLLLARLGLRAGEVVTLELADIDWNAGQLRVCGKSGSRNELPLPAEVGRAIAAYLRSGRACSTSRRVFLRARAPCRGFQGAAGVDSIIRHRFQRAGISAPSMGAHQFRHALASAMLREGASLNEIGEVLGHRHPQTTTIYIKVDLIALRALALPWPGGVR